MASPQPPQDVDMADPTDVQRPLGEDPENGDAEGSEEEDEEGEMIDDSSEEGEDNEEDLRKVAQGFIVEDEDEEPETDPEEKARRRQERKERRKRKKLRNFEDDDLDEDDLELMEENTGIRTSRQRLTRLRRGRVASRSASPEDNDYSQRPPREFRRDEDDINELQRMFDDDRRELDDADMDDGFLEDEDDFIDDEGEEGEMNEEERRERRRAEKERRRAMGARPEMAGIDPAAWDEIFEVFGDGRDYEWALDGDEGADDIEELAKPEMKYTDVFEPSEIKARHLTEEDDIIRINDIPERMQLSTSSLSPSATLSLHEDFNLQDYDVDAAGWVAPRISSRIIRDYFRPNATHSDLRTELIVAVKNSLELMLTKNFEVPYIYTHRRDLISHYDPDKRVRIDLLSKDELWRVGTLGGKFRALMERKQVLLKTFQKMGVEDDHFERDIFPNLNSIEAVADATEWLGLMHRQAQKDIMEAAALEEDSIAEKKFKKPTRTSPYELAKQTVSSKLADDFGLKSRQIIQNFLNTHNQGKSHFTIDPEIPPGAYAEQFITDSPGVGGRNAEEQLATARMLIATELGKDPLLRGEIRKLYEKESLVSVTLTEKGRTKIDDFHPYQNFSFLKDKPIQKMLESPQFLYMLQAESDNLINIHISIDPHSLREIEEQLFDAFRSDSANDAGDRWNEERRLVVKEVLDKHLLPVGLKWVREWLRDEVEDHLAKKCGDALQYRINSAPYKTPDIEFGDVPSVLAISWGKGDPSKDAVHAIILDEAGRLRDHIKLDNFVEQDNRETFLDLVKRRNPDVVVIGGFTVATRKLVDQVRELLGYPVEENAAPQGSQGKSGGDAPPASGSQNQNAASGGGWGDPNAGSGGGGGGWGDSGGWGAGGSSSNDTSGGWGSSNNADSWGGSNNNPNGWDNNNAGGSSPPRGSPERSKKSSKEKQLVPVTYVNDEVARIYQHSTRAEDEYGRIPLVGRYCIGLARYTQSPLNEYAALGSDLTAITFDDGQHLVPKEKLLVALERALVNVVNLVGVDINRSVVDTYYQALLPFVAGLGPRKAQQLVQRISTMGGTLANRTQLISENILTMQVFLNAAGFLRISQEGGYKRSSKKRKHKDPEDVQPDPLDDTRIHPEDYDLARKMAMDALEVDEEDLDDDGHPSQLVTRLMEDDDCGKKLDMLNLDDFAQQLVNTMQEKKRFALGLIKDEIIRPFGEQRGEFVLPDKWDVVTMLTGETEETLARGKIVSVSVLRIKNKFVAVKLDSGIEGVIHGEYLSNEGNIPADNIVAKGQTIPAVIISVFVDQFKVELSARPQDLQLGDVNYRRVATDEYYDQGARLKQKDLLDRRKRGEVDKVRRVIKHPNFYNFNYIQAQKHLAGQQRGDVVIRPSTKGPDHLAVTWKVDDGLYQHIDVVDPNADLNSQTVGTHLIVDGRYHYSDLDELIVNHVKAMARKVEELMAHEKFHKGTDAEIHEFLENALKAQRGAQTRSVYAFGLNRERPGNFGLHFKTKVGSPIATWPVKVTPTAFVLYDGEFGSVPDLCDGFKRRIMTAITGDPAAGGRTPYASRTPAGAQTPGRATPGHMSSRQTPATAAMMGKTPNPYANSSKTPNPYAGNQPQVPAGRTPVPPHSASGGWGSTPSGGGSWGSGANGSANGGWDSNTSNTSNSAGGWNNSNSGGWGPPSSATSGPPGMNPARAAMIKDSSKNGGWGAPSGGRGGW
ncbi:Transcription elongation factor spt6 [Tulasnella sp. 419]|nr:Transcription elongation factor spt6 [Tulasnella sp. 419]